MSAMPSPDQLRTFLDIATEAALAAGAVLKEHQGTLVVHEKGATDNIVTEADKASEAVLLEAFQRHLPDHAILSEEAGALGQQDNPYLWAIDPLDGTTNYAHQYPVFAVSIGLLVDGIPSLGVIYDPSKDELFRGAIGLGATCNRCPIQVSQANDLAKSLLVTGFAYDRRETEDNNYAEFCHFTHLTQGVRRGGAAALDLAYVACGRLDAYWERGLSPWDIVAGVAILREAGGKVTAYDGSPLMLDSGRILATNGHLHQTLSTELQQVHPLAAWQPPSLSL